MIHSGITIDPKTGVPVHETKSLPRIAQLSQSEREQLYTDIGFNVYDSWESDVLRIGGPVYYWEVQVLSTVNSDFDISSVAIGLTPVTAGSFDNYRCSISDIHESVSYHSSGTRFRPEMPPEHIHGSGYGTHDIVGCGWEIGGEGRVFFTCNGKIVGNCLSGFGTQGQTYYPTLELYGIGTTARANFGGSRFQLLLADRLRISNIEMVEYAPTPLPSPQPTLPTAHPAPNFSTSPVATVASSSRGTWTNRIQMTSGASSPPFMGANTMEYPVSTPSPRGLSGKNTNRRNSDGTGYSGVYGYPPARQRTTSANNTPANQNLTSPRTDREGGIATQRAHQRGVVSPLNSTEEELVALASALSLEEQNLDIDADLPADSLTWTLLDTQEVQEALALLQQLVLTSPAVTAVVEQKEVSNSSQSEIVLQLSSNLRRMQKKLLRVIQNENVNPEIYSALLELNHSVAFILDFAKDYLASFKPERSPSRAPLESIASVAEDGRRRTESAVLPHELPSVVSIMYMLRRGSRAEVSSAVSQLLMMCDLGESNSDKSRKSDVADILNDIRSAGGLQTLVSALSRCNEWPDVELKISLAIAIMIANESDWHLLVKDVHSLLNTLQSLLHHGAELTNLLASADNQNYFPIQSLNARRLVASAISRLCLVLCAEWGKPSSGTFTDFGMFLISADVEQLPSSALQFHRKLSGNQERKRDRVLNSSDSEANLSKMLKTVMSIIKTLSPLPSGYGKTNSPLSPRPPPSATRRRSSSQTAATTIPFDSSESLSLIDAMAPTLNAVPLNPPPPHWTKIYSSGGTLHRSLSESSGINNQDKIVSRPVSLQLLLPLTTDSLSNHDPDSDTETEPVIDEALVPCSVALSNLLQIEECRATLVKDGALSLLACWLDVAANVLQWHNSARFHASTPNASDDNVGLNLTDFTSPLSHSSVSPLHALGNCKKQLDIMRSSSVGSSNEGGAEVGGILRSGHPVYELINNVSGSVMSLTTNSTLSQSENRRGRSPNSNYNAGRIDAMVMGEGLPSAICRFLYASTYDYTLSNLPSWKTLQSPILPRGGAIALSEAMCAMAKRSQNRESMLEAGAPQAIIRLLVDAILRRKKIDHGLDDDLPKFYPTEEYGPRKLERLQREHTAETLYLSTLSENCLQMLSHFVSDSIATIPPHKMNSTSAPLSTPHDWNNNSNTTHAASSSSSCSLPLIIQLLIHPRVVDAIKYITNQPRGTCRLAAVRVISMLVEWPEALDMLHSQRISDVLMVIVAESHDIFEFEVLGKPPQPPRLERGTSRDSTKTESEADSVQTNSNQSLEVLMRACYTLAHICSSKLTYAFELFENGLMTIMLKSAKHDHIEVQRQAVRCISSMCPVLSSLIPGRHPAIVIEELQMNKNTGKVLRNRSDSINEIRARAAKAQVNLLAFVEALYALAHALTSQSTLVQREAVRGISFLAIDEHLRVGIVEGPLRVIIRIMIDPSCEPELKYLAETVLVNIGFHNGQKDLEVVANDYELLSEWFYVRKSLRPQALGLDLLHHWVNTIFYGVNEAEKKTRQHFLLAELGREVSEKEFDENSMSLHLANGLDVDLRDTIDLLGLSLMKSMIERIIRHRPSDRGVGASVGGIGYSITPMNPNGGLHEALLQQFSHLFDAWKMLRNGIPIDLQSIDAAHSIVTPEFHIEHSVMPSMPPLSRSKTGGYLTDRFLSFLSFCSGRTQAQQILMEEEDEEHYLKQRAKDAGGPVAGMVMSREEQPTAAAAAPESKSSLPNGEELESDDLVNHPPRKVQELLDLFFPSKLYQMYLTDMISLGQPLPMAVASAEPTMIASVRQHSDICLGTPPRVVVYNDRNFSQRYKVPEPKSFRALLLPSRTYYTFRREGRIIQRIFDDLASNNPIPKSPDNSPSPSTLEDSLLTQMRQEAAYMGGYVDSANTLWTLCFRESTFQGDFMISLLSTLRRCPQIASLNFISRRPEQDSELGYFAGSLPGSIRYISFESSLSSQAIEVMCVMLKTQNPAFLLHPERDGFVNDTDSLNGQEDSSSQGLLGLAIKSTLLTNSDIKSLCELLDPSEEYINLMTGRFNEKDSKSSFSGTLPRKSDDALASPPLASPVPRMNGLRFLDLSENRLSDEQVSTIIYACIGGPLEGLELHGNSIYRGLYLSAPLQIYLTSTSCQLTHLGLGANALINSTFRNILSFCQNSATLTSLDFSSNSLSSSENTRVKVREYLKKNRHLRTLNLSNNKFTLEIVRDVHLGLMENESLILLNMERNISTNPREMRLVRQKLKLNRDRYVKGHPAGAGHLTPHAHAVSSSFSTMAPHPHSGHPIDSPNVFSPSGANEPLPKPALHNFVSESNMVSSGEAIEVSVTILPEGNDGRDVPRKAQSEVRRKSERAKSSSVLGGVNVDSAGIRRQLTYDDSLSPLTNSGTAAADPEEFEDFSVTLTDAESTPRDLSLQTAIPTATIATKKESGKKKDDRDFDDYDLEDDDQAEEALSGDQIFLSVLFSAPLAWQDTRNQLHPIQTLDYAGEREALVQVFHEAKRDVGLRFDFATTEALRTVVTLGCKALHFSGHGHPHCLNFEDGRSGLQFITIEQLSELCKAGDLKLEFVFVSACYSSKAAEAFVQAGVQHVVCVSVDAQLLDAAAMAFTRAFYLALLVGHTVRHSFDLGKQAVATSPYVPNGSAEGSKFLLLPETNSHDLPIFTAKTIRKWPPAHHGHRGITTDSIEHSYLPRPPEDFEGREIDMHHVIKILLNRRLVSVVGEPGVGKSAVAVGSCCYMWERKHFADGIVYVRLHGVSTYSGLLHAISQAMISGSPKLAKRFNGLSKIFREKIRPAMKYPSVEDGEQLGRGSGAKSAEGDPIREHEDLLLHCLATLRVLLVLDHLNDILYSENDTVTDFKMFLSRLFERCRNIKVLTTCTDPIGLTHGFGMVENSVSIGPLSLRSSLRLFARLCPSLLTAKEKSDFVRSLLIKDQGEVTLESREVSAQTAQILYMLGGGHPGRIVKISCETKKQNLNELLTKGLAIVHGGRVKSHQHHPPGEATAAPGTTSATTTQHTPSLSSLGSSSASGSQSMYLPDRDTLDDDRIILP